MSYQSIGDIKGASNSQAKLQALHLPERLDGKRVLDLGCNEGFFSLEAKRRGASRVVGIDYSEDFVTKARQHAAAVGLDIEYRHGDMFGLPDEQFDFVFLFSALHYIERPAKLFARIREVLAPGGTLVLELGVSPRSGVTIDRALRSVDERFFPTRELLTQHWLKGFSARSIGNSVQQVGDPIQRFVYHCTPSVPTVLFIEGKGGIGKTTLSRKFGDSPVISTDELFNPKRDPSAKGHPIQSRYEEMRDATRNIWLTWDRLKAEPEVRDYFTRVIVDAIRQCDGADTIVVEGFVVAALRPAIEAALGEGFRCWSIGRPKADAEVPWEAVKP